MAKKSAENNKNSKNTLDSTPDIIKNSKKIINLGGRPHKYKQIFCKRMIDHFSIDPYKIVELTKVTKDGREVKTTEIVPNRLPTFANFAWSIGVDHNTVLNWVNAVDSEGKPKYPEFLGAYTQCKELQKDFLNYNALSGNYDSRYAVFLATNITEYRNKTSAEHTGKNGEPIKTETNITESENLAKWLLTQQGKPKDGS